MKQWLSYQVDPAELRIFLQKSGLPHLIGRILFHRGIREVEEAQKVLFPTLSSLGDPFLMVDMDRAVARIEKALAQREKILIYGDYDADGVTATALLWHFFQDLGHPVEVFFPHREKDGYGFHAHLINQLRNTGASLIITVDCGITGHEAAKLAQEAGLEVIITDHHQVPEELPPAVAVLNPQRRDCRYPEKNLAGVGVALTLARAVRAYLFQKGILSRKNMPNLKKLLDLVALGTIADIAPLTGENRTLAKVGLDLLSGGHRPGIRALKAVSGLEGQRVGTTEVTFRLGPRINAAGRIEEALQAFKLLTTNDPGEAQKLAQRLGELNAQRQRLENQILKEAQALIDRKAPAQVLAGANWPKGILGIVASKIQEQLTQPVILLSIDDSGLAKGSGRSPEGLDLYKLLRRCREHLLGFGGHSSAAGLALEAAKLEAFTRAFEEATIEELSRSPLVPHIKIDAAVTLKDLLDPDFLDFFGHLEPFGPGWPEPVFALSGFKVRQQKTVGNGHLKLLVWQEGLALEAVGFGLGELVDQGLEEFELAVTPEFRDYQGETFLRLRLCQLRPRRLVDEAIRKT
ncbi:single-stranded-DNA-specific exonuclease RecJ [Thermosulfuriphilus sp.]